MADCFENEGFSAASWRRKSVPEKLVPSCDNASPVGQRGPELTRQPWRRPPFLGTAQEPEVGVSMGVFSDGNPYGVPNGIVCSFPVQCGEGALGAINKEPVSRGVGVG